MPDEQIQPTLPGVEAQPVDTPAAEVQQPQTPTEAEVAKKEAMEAKLEAAKLTGMLEAMRQQPSATPANTDAIKAQLQRLKEQVAADPANIVDVMFETLKARDDAWKTQMDSELQKRDQYWGAKIVESSPKFRELAPVMEKLKTHRVWEFLSKEDQVSLAEHVAGLSQQGTRPQPQGSPAGTQSRGAASTPEAAPGAVTGDPRLDALLVRTYGDQPRNVSIWEGR